MRNRKGIVLPLFALFLISALGLGALVIDIGSGYSVKTKIQNAIDLSVVAACSQIYSGSSVTSVKDTALSYLNSNLSSAIPSFQTLSLDSQGLSIEVGTYDTSSMTFVVNEAIPPANSIKISYIHTLPTFFAPIFMINSFNVGEDGIAVKKGAGYMAPGTGFPLTINSSALLDALSNNNMLDLYQGGTTNSYWTKFTDDNPSASDVKNIINYFQNGSGTAPSGLSVNDDFVFSNGSLTVIYNEMEPSILEGMTFVFPVVTLTMADTVVADGFLGATINDIVDSMGTQYISITIIPGFIDNTFCGLGPSLGPSNNISSQNQALLANAYGLVQ